MARLQMPVVALAGSDNGKPDGGLASEGLSEYRDPELGQHFLQVRHPIAALQNQGEAV